MTEKSKSIQTEIVNPENQWIVDTFNKTEQKIIETYEQTREALEDGNFSGMEILEFAVQLPSDVKAVQDTAKAIRALKGITKAQRYAIFAAAFPGGSVEDSANKAQSVINYVSNTASRIERQISETAKIVKALRKKAD